MFVITAAGCGGSGSSTPQLPTIAAARTYALAAFSPEAAPKAGRLVTLSFTIRQPSGGALTAYRHGSGPHTGVHLIVVRSDLGAIVHEHPPVGPDGKIVARVTFPTPGRYRVVVDAYPATGPQRNFQLFRWIRVGGASTPKTLPPFRRTQVVDGYRFTLAAKPKLHAIEAAFLTVGVTTPQGRPAHFTPWFGALAHAIFFRAGTLDYFHTHVCGVATTGCTSTLGGAGVAGRSQAPGKLTVGVLVPTAGTWRLFLQCKVDGHVLTAPFTLTVR
jgi:hypothetical protein